MFVQLIPQVSSAALNAVKAQLARGVSVAQGAITNLMRPATPSSTAGPAVTAAAAGTGGMAALGTAVSEAFSKVKDVVNDIISNMRMVADLVGKANPAVLERFNDVFEDVEAVIGVRLIPLVEHWTNGLRVLVDFLHSVLPSTAEFQRFFAEYKPLLNDVREALREMAPLIKDILLVSIRLATQALHDFVAVMREIVMIARRMPGISLFAQYARATGQQDQQLRSSIGTAARPFRFESHDDFGRQLILNALNRGKDSAADQTADNTARTADGVERLATVLGPMVSAFIRNPLRFTNPGNAFAAVGFLANQVQHG